MKDKLRKIAFDPFLPRDVYVSICSNMKKTLEKKRFGKKELLPQLSVCGQKERKTTLFFTREQPQCFTTEFQLTAKKIIHKLT